jgi:hypothetical protein
MQLSIIIAILGAVCTLASPIIALLIKEKRQNRLLQTITSSCRKAIEGNWKLTCIHEIKGEGIPDGFTGVLSFEAGQKIVKGKIAYENYKRGPTVLKLKGGFYNDRFLKLEYENEVYRIIQFGVIILELSANGSTLRGRLLGYGPESEMLVTAKITAEISR